MLCSRPTRLDEATALGRPLGCAGHAWRLRDLRDAGATVALGSDWLIAYYDARTVPATARAPRGGASVRAGPTGLEALEALEGVTTRAARAAGEAEVTGRIAAGCRADFTARALDPVQGPADELAQAPVLLTVPGGHVVHRTQ